MNSFIKTNNHLALFVCVLLAGTFLRFLISFNGYSIDVEHWRINAYLINLELPIYGFGGNNYGPIWIHILYYLDKIPIYYSDDELLNLRYNILFFLTTVDVLIFLIIYKIHSLKIATLFFLNPISIYVTGFHGQFENLAVLIGLLGVLSFSKFKKKSKYLIFNILLGVSLMSKHILMFFPIWAAIKEKKLLNKIYYIIPYLLFFIAFLPFVPHIEIALNELNHNSNNNYPFWSIFTPSFLGNYIGYRNLFIISVLLVGLILQKRNLIESYYLYLIALVVFAPGISNQYFCISVVGIAFFWNRFFFFYTVTAALFYLVDDIALNIEWLKELSSWTKHKRDIGFKIIIFFLTLGLFQEIFTKKKFDNIVISIFNYFYKKVKNQFNY